MVDVIFRRQDYGDVKAGALCQRNAVGIGALPIQCQDLKGRNPGLGSSKVVCGLLRTEFPLEVYFTRVAVGDHQLPCRRIADGGNEILPQSIAILVVERGSLGHIGCVMGAGGIFPKIVQTVGIRSGISQVVHSA